MIKSAPAALASAKPPLLQLPAAPTDNRFYLLWSTDGFPKMVNGRSTYIPPSFRKALKHAATFPSASSIRWLRAHGVRTVVVHTEFSNQRLGEKFEGSFHRGRVYRSPTWAQATARRAPPGSGVTRTLSKPLVIYHLRR